MSLKNEPWIGFDPPSIFFYAAPWGRGSLPCKYCLSSPLRSLIWDLINLKQHVTAREYGRIQQFRNQMSKVAGLHLYIYAILSESNWRPLWPFASWLRDLGQSFFRPSESKRKGLIICTNDTDKDVKYGGKEIFKQHFHTTLYCTNNHRCCLSACSEETRELIKKGSILGLVWYRKIHIRQRWTNNYLMIMKRNVLSYVYTFSRDK